MARRYQDRVEPVPGALTTAEPRSDACLGRPNLASILMSRNISRTLMCVAAAIVVVTATTGAATSSPTEDRRSPVAQTVRALVTEPAEDAASTIPSDFADVMGYRPAVQDGMASNPGGDCSSPIPLPPEFEAACRAHDLGYDLLRYANATGTTVDPQWRRAIDAQLDSRMHDACHHRTDDGSRQICDAAAVVAATAVDLNSWRQSFGAPVAEPAMPLTLFGAVLALTLLIALVVARYRRVSMTPTLTYRR